jgi:hypothetical protein
MTISNEMLIDHDALGLDNANQWSVPVPRTIDVSFLAESNAATKVNVPYGVQILENGDVKPKSHHMFRILHPLKGDERLCWDSTNFADIKGAKQLFVDLIEKGLTPYRVGVNGKATSEVMDEFDPMAEEVIFMSLKLVVGG